MENHRFDDLTKTLAGGASRRSALKTLAGGAAGALAVLIGRPAAAAPPAGKGPSKSDCCPAEAPRLCSDLTCRECCADADCADGGTCSNGTCVIHACPTASVCGSSVYPCNEAGTCLCVGTTEGANACIALDGTSCTEAPICGSSADCPEGAVCVMEGACCDTPVCAPLCTEP